MWPNVALSCKHIDQLRIGFSLHVNFYGLTSAFGLFATSELYFLLVNNNTDILLININSLIFCMHAVNGLDVRRFPME